MNNTHTPSYSSTLASCKGDFRLNYLDIYRDADAQTVKPMNANDHVQATPNFPCLADPVCKSMLVSATLERLEATGINPETSNVSLQGWVERYARSCGYENVPLPTGFALWRFRLGCLFCGMKTLKDDAFSNM